VTAQTRRMRNERSRLPKSKGETKAPWDHRCPRINLLKGVVECKRHVNQLNVSSMSLKTVPLWHDVSFGPRMVLLQYNF